MLLLSLAAAAAMASAAAPQASEPALAPPPAEPADSEAPGETSEDASEVEEVVVTGTRAEVVRRIDRQVYDISRDKLAQALPILDTLGKLPSVIVTPDGAIRLLGESGVTVLIDGKRPANLQSALRSLNGSDVERIEISTNPSAAERPDGAAGVINIVLRKDRRQGWTGTVTAAADSQGGVNLNLSPSLTRGRWSVQTSLGAYANRNEGGGEVERRLLDANGAIVREELQRQERSQESRGVDGRLRLGFKPSDKDSFGLSIQGFYSDGDSAARTRYTSPDPAFAAYTSRGASGSTFRSGEVSVDYEHAGAVEGEKLSAEAKLSLFHWASDELIRYAYESPALPDPLYRFGFDTRSRDLSAKLDYVRPYEKDRLLSTGLLWERDGGEEAQTFADVGGDGALGPDYRLLIDGRRDTAAAYATYQFVWGKWTVLPGARVEEERLDLRAGGARAERSQLDWFPSLHLKRDLTETLNLNLSYSKRVERPAFSQLSPQIRYFDNDTAMTGNPDLGNTVTHASEAKIGWKIGRQDVQLTLYDRRSEDVVEWVTELRPGGVQLNRPINAGELVNQGAELALRGPVGERWKYAFTGNLYIREAEALVGGRLRPFDEVTYSGNASLEYRTRAADPLLADQVSLSLQYYGPRRDLQGESDGTVWADLTWRHPLTKKLAANLRISDLFDSADMETILRTDAFEEEQRWYGAGPQVRLSLTYQLGDQP